MNVYSNAGAIFKKNFKVNSYNAVKKCAMYRPKSNSLKPPINKHKVGIKLNTIMIHRNTCTTHATRSTFIYVSIMLLGTSMGLSIRGSNEHT